MPKIAIVIDVPDIPRATSFYCEALGCSLQKERESHNTLELDGITIHLGLREAGSVPTPKTETTRNYSRHWTPVHLDFDVEDMDAATARVERLGGTVEEHKKGDWGSAAFCADPFGNGFCLLDIRE